jgi:hypothetical protein
MSGSVVLRHEKSTEELMVMQQKYNRLESNHNVLLERRRNHKFMKGPSYYIISDIESNCVKYKPGIDTVDVNMRLTQHRSTSPGIKLELLIYCGVSECRLLESCILERYSGKRNYSNHEWIYDVDKDHIISSTMTMLDFLGIEYTREVDIDKYNV